MKIRYSFFLLFFLTAHSLFSQNIVINEFVSSNGSTLTDYNGKYEDWIELYNGGVASVNLSGYHLSDNLSAPFKWTFPSVTINSGQYLVIFASGKDTVYSNLEIHTNFSISASGEKMILTDPSGTLLDQSDSVNLDKDISYGRQPDGSGPWYYFTTVTPGSSNSGINYTGILSAPVFSAKGGFYTSSFNLTLTNADPAATIRYTLDGSVPVDTSLIYTSPLIIKSRTGDVNYLSLIPSAFPSNWDVPAGEIEKATVVRVRTFKSGALSSGVVTNTYFVDNNINSRYDMPVISLTTNKENFFDSLIGINVPGKVFDDYVAANPADTIRNGGTPANYNQSGAAWERPANIEFFESNGTRGFTQKMGVDIHGNYSRANRQKSYNLKPGTDYDTKDLINYSLFPGLTQQANNKPLKKFKTVMLRNSGGDWGSTMLRDGFMQSLVSHTTLDIQAYRPIVLFIDGEYWGIHEMREKPDKYYFENNYGFNADSVTILVGYNSIAEGPVGTEAHYDNILNYVNTNNILTNSGFDFLNTQMDISNYADYFASEIYWNNGDWPGNNVKFWRKNVVYNPSAPYGQDGRWRWLVYDTDFGFNLWNIVTGNWRGDYTFNTLDFATKAGLTSWPNPDWSTFLFRRMLLNPTFKVLFINRVADHLNSSFKEARVTAKLTETSNLLAHEMPAHVKRWKAPSSVGAWIGMVNDMSVFASHRPAYMRQHVISQFGLSGTVNVALDVSDQTHGKIKINSLLIDQNTVGIVGEAYPWSGIYFQGVPVSIQAIPETGYRFVRWEGNSSSESALSLTMSSDESLKAIFEIDDHITVYPNPSNGSFFVQVDNLTIGNGYVKLYDMLGKEVYTSSFYKTKVNFKVPVEIAGNIIPMGIYVVQVEVGGKWYRTKLIIER